ncbi:MAG: hypothetical protein EXR53_04925 [Dehalococcoidia bacterium]|nr:hypothetical protein [Dehalococcoidia bacterium]
MTKNYSTVAGTLLLIAGATMLMGIITSEASYSDLYSTHTNDISDLGAKRPDGTLLQPSAIIFNASMIISGP